MKYVYPKFSAHEGIGFRLGGPGLGNLLFIWSRAYVFALQNGMKMLWPTWPSLKLGPWLRNERDKRTYIHLFENNGIDLAGWSKYRRLMFGKKRRYDPDMPIQSLPEETVVLYDRYAMDFNGLKEYRREIVDYIQSHLGQKGRQALAFDGANAVNLHVRLGDFAVDTSGSVNGKNNCRIPISWFCHVVNAVKQVCPGMVFHVFSDGSDEELRDLLAMDNVERVFFGNSVADIMALSKAPLIIASGSSFSMWARFIGNCNSISFPSQKKDDTADADRFEIELEQGAPLPDDVVQKIRAIYNGSFAG
ncbi:MAG: alpha-1,2-fucosyltransferase [Anaerotruncus rubiinfantis]|jgi:hypothetical protein